MNELPNGALGLWAGNKMKYDYECEQLFFIHETSEIFLLFLSQQQQSLYSESEEFVFVLVNSLSGVKVVNQNWK
jgi:hypothetical protein